MVRRLKLKVIAHTYACHRFILNIYIYIHNHDSPRCNFCGIKKKRKKENTRQYIVDYFPFLSFSFFSISHRSQSSKLIPHHFRVVDLLLVYLKVCIYVGRFTTISLLSRAPSRTPYSRLIVDGSGGGCRIFQRRGRPHHRSYPVCHSPVSPRLFYCSELRATLVAR